jgi:tRNA pseudouridine32 synthase / 23S rRNA pseudouridine746 synthase
MIDTRPIFFKRTLEAVTPHTICHYLADSTGLSKGRIKDAMIKGAVWISNKGGKRRRLRRATAIPRVGDTLELYFDPALLAIRPMEARCVDDRRRYSVWFKPAGMMAQGTDYGDHSALLRQVEIHFRPQRQVFLVHRLDREAEGLMLVAHDRQAAARLSALFRDNGISKHYRVQVRGAMGETRGVIDLPLDGKRALTRYTVADYHAASDVTTLDVMIETGRFHQIRRHLALCGHPAIGDPKYGAGNKNNEGLRLAAVGLRFRCPFGGETLRYAVHESFGCRL